MERASQGNAGATLDCVNGSKGLFHKVILWRANPMIFLGFGPQWGYPLLCVVSPPFIVYTERVGGSSPSPPTSAVNHLAISNSHDGEGISTRGNDWGNCFFSKPVGPNPRAASLSGGLAGCFGWLELARQLHQAPQS